MHDDFGCNLREFLFAPSDDRSLRGNIAARIKDQVGRWMPGVKLLEIFVLLPEDDFSVRDNQIRVKMKFQVGVRVATIDEVIGG